MSAHSDHPQFTANVLGETTPAGRAAFEASLLRDPESRAEAVGIQRIADKLAAALKSEPAVHLTLTQRNAVLNPATAARSTAAIPVLTATAGTAATEAAPFVVLPAASGAGKSAASVRPIRRGPRPAWLAPTLATAGIAAAIVLGMNVLSGMPATSPTSGNAATGIPTVAIQSVKPSTPASPAAGHATNPVLVNSGGSPDPSLPLPRPTPGLPGAGPATSGKPWEALAVQPPVLPPMPPTRSGETAPVTPGGPPAPPAEYASPRSPIPGEKRVSTERLAAPAPVPAPSKP